MTPPGDDAGTPAIVTDDLTKTFGSQLVVDGVGLSVPRGSVYGFLGPNGSGKTTTIRMLLGLISPSKGSATVLGHGMPDRQHAALPHVGALIEGPAFHPYLSGHANLLRIDAADRTVDPSTARRRADAALDRVGLLAARTKRYRAYSLGMRQRLAIAAALLRPRDLLVLDEPTNGLDPQGTREVRALVGHLAQDGTTVFVSSHLLSEVEQMCSHLGVMRQGRLVAQGTLTELRDRSTREVVVATADLPTAQAAAAVLSGLGIDDAHVEAIAADHGQADLRAVGRLDGQAPEPIVVALVEAGVGVRGFQVRSPSLEDLYVGLTGEGFDVSG